MPKESVDARLSRKRMDPAASTINAQRSEVVFQHGVHGMGMARVERTRQLPDIVPQDNRNEPEDTRTINPRSYVLLARVNSMLSA